MEVIALFRGRAHVLVKGNEAHDAMVPRELYGMPVTEAFPDDRWKPIQALMDAVFADGQDRVMIFEGGQLTVTCLRDRRGRRLGVGTSYLVPEPAPPPPVRDRLLLLPAAVRRRGR